MKEHLLVISSWFPYHGKEETAGKLFLAPLAEGQRAIVMAW